MSMSVISGFDSPAGTVIGGGEYDIGGGIGGAWGELSACATYQASSCETIHRISLCMSVPGLMLLGGDSTVEVVRFEELNDAEAEQKRTRFKTTLLRKYHIGSRACALDWSANTEELANGDLFIEFCVGCQDRQVRYVSAKINKEESRSDLMGLANEDTIKVFGSGTSGHRSTINDLAYCPTETFQGIIATVSDDCTCLIWNLNAQQEENENVEEDGPSFNPISSPIPHNHPVLGVSFHREHASLLMTYDVTSTVRLIDWVKAERPIVMTLVDPVGMSRVLTSSGSTTPQRGGMEWQSHDSNTVAAAIESRWMVWDMTKHGGARPVVQGVGFADGCDRIKWSRVNRRMVAVSTSGERARGRIKVVDTTSGNSVDGGRMVYEGQGGVEDIGWDAVRDVLCASMGNKVKFYDCR